MQAGRCRQAKTQVCFGVQTLVDGGLWAEMNFQRSDNQAAEAEAVAACSFLAGGLSHPVGR